MAYGKQGGKLASSDAIGMLLDKAIKVITGEKGKTLADVDKDKATHIAQVVHHGTQLIIPDGMTKIDALKTLVASIEYEDQDVCLSRKLDVFPYDGAKALDLVLTQMFGWSQVTSTPTWFGPQPPELIDVRTGPDTFIQVPWGTFAIMGIEGSIQVGVARTQEGRYQFAMTANIKRRDEATVKNIFDLVTEHLKQNSIYRGHAIKIKFRNDSGDLMPMPTPEFIDTDKIDETMLIYSKSVYDAINTNLFTPIQRLADCIANGIPIKRGVLLGGTYGTGKTLGASVAAKYAVQAGITVVYVARAKELPEALEFAKQYSAPACVVFCEDIDREMSDKGEEGRTEEMDQILNLIDGLDTKSHNIMVVVTTNELKRIEPALLRPGRLDAVIEVTPPDAEAVERLLRKYGVDAIEPDTDLSEAGLLLAGENAAIVAEVVKRAKLSQIKFLKPGEKVRKLSASALVDASRTMKTQMDLLKDAAESRRKLPGVNTMETMLATIVEEKTSEVVEDKVENLANDVASMRALLLKVAQAVRVV